MQRFQCGTCQRDLSTRPPRVGLLPDPLATLTLELPANAPQRRVSSPPQPSSTPPLPCASSSQKSSHLCGQERSSSTSSRRVRRAVYQQLRFGGPLATPAS